MHNNDGNDGSWATRMISKCKREDKWYVLQKLSTIEVQKIYRRLEVRWRSWRETLNGVKHLLCPTFFLVKWEINIILPKTINKQKQTNFLAFSPSKRGYGELEIVRNLQSCKYIESSFFSCVFMIFMHVGSCSQFFFLRYIHVQILPKCFNLVDHEH